MSRARRSPKTEATDEAAPETPCSLSRYLCPRKSITPSTRRSPKYDPAGLAEMAIVATADSSARVPAARIGAIRIASAAERHRPQFVVRCRKRSTALELRMPYLLPMPSWRARDVLANRTAGLPSHNGDGEVLTSRVAQSIAVAASVMQRGSIAPRSG